MRVKEKLIRESDIIDWLDDAVVQVDADERIDEESKRLFAGIINALKEDVKDLPAAPGLIGRIWERITSNGAERN